MMFRYKPRSPQAPAITVMDGPFVSLFPYEGGYCTLSSVEWTRLGRFETVSAAQEQIRRAKSADVRRERANSEDVLCEFFPSFKEGFEFQDTLFSVKTILNDASDARVCMVQQEGRALHVISGKIDSVFYASRAVQDLIM